MNLVTVCLLVLSISASLAYRSSSGANDENSTQAKTDLFDSMLKMIKYMLCTNKDQGGDDNSDDLFQMIINLARIFLCEDNTPK